VPNRPIADVTTGSAWVEQCYKVNFKQQWYKGGNVKLRMPSWTDRILCAAKPATPARLPRRAAA
jgi:hypothetical protein